MKYRQLPNSDLKLSAVGFGLWTVATSWWGEFTDEQAIGLMKKAYDDYGINFFDAADTYGNGRSETLFPAQQRENIVIGTKFAYDIYSNPEERKGQRELPQQTSPEYIRFALEESLKRLKTDYLDMYQIHNAKMEHIVDDSLFETLEALKQEGKIRHYGVALGPAIGWLTEGVLAIKERKIDALMVIHSLLEQHPGNAFIQACHENHLNTGLMVRVPHASGMLEGHYNENTTFEKSDHRSHRPKHWLTNGLKKVEQLRFLENSQRSLGQVAIQWLLAEQSVSTVLPNIYNEEQLKEFGTASDSPELTLEEVEKIKVLVEDNFGITDEPPMMYKGNMVTPSMDITGYRKQLEEHTEAELKQLQPA